MMQHYSAGILLHQHTLLLGLRSSTREQYPGVWDFIGGHCLPNETFEEAAKRELLEELNIVVTACSPLLTINDPHFVLQLFHITAWRGEIRNHAPQEHEQVAWFSFTEARALLFPHESYYNILHQIEQLIFSV